MQFISTRGDSNALSSTQAIIRGIAPDKGLYVPSDIPKLGFDPEDMKGKPYQEIAKAVLGRFFDDIEEDVLCGCVDGAYDEKFDTGEIVPVVEAGGAHFLELYHGKTAAFKDMALSILPRLMTASSKIEGIDQKICILTATSGDTGKAALEGFADVEGTEIIVFYPESGVSEVQKRQMVTQTGDNTHVFALRGNFDDAQTEVKNAFQDEDFREKLLGKGIRLSSANSINIGRLAPQIVYYVYSYVKLLERGVIGAGDRINIVVPTGNFGNILAAYYAKEMGLPVRRFICASNKNKVLTDFFSTGVYDINREFYLTNSPSMDILISSNLERLLYHFSGGDAGMIRELMTKLERDRSYEVGCDIKGKLSGFYAGFATPEETLDTIGEMWNENHYLLDTHTAVAYKVYRDYVAKTGDDTPTVIASTASPYKFAEAVSGAIGLPEEENGFEYIKALEKHTGVGVPAGLRDLDKREVRHKEVIGKEEVEKAVEEAL